MIGRAACQGLDRVYSHLFIPHLLIAVPGANGLFLDNPPPSNGADTYVLRNYFGRWKFSQEPLFLEEESLTSSSIPQGNSPL